MSLEPIIPNPLLGSPSALLGSPSALLGGASALLGGAGSRAWRRGKPCLDIVSGVMARHWRMNALALFTCFDRKIARTSILGILRLVLSMTVFGFRLAPILLVIYWICIFTGTHLPGIPGPKPLVSDKVMHFLAFTGLAFFAAWALPSGHGKGGKRLGWAALALVLYAAVDELSQSFVPRRSAEFADFVADCCGIVAGFSVYLILRTLLLAYLRRQTPLENRLRARRQVISHVMSESGRENG